MRLEDLNWFDVEGYLKEDDRLMLVLGSCEQHAYLSLLTDVRIPLALADTAGQQTGVLVAPAVSYGCSPYFMAYPGTLSLRISTLLDVVEDITRSAYAHGFRRVLVLNGHGGNEPVKGRLYELANELPALQLRWYAWWHSNSVQEIAIKHKLKPSHANWSEAFVFTQVAQLPSNEKPPPNVPGLIGATEARQVYGDGSFGGFYVVDESIMDEILAVALQDVLALLSFD